MKKLLFLILITSLPAFSQVNIEKQRLHREKDGIGFSADWAVTYLQGNSELLSTNLAPQAVLRYRKHMTFLLSDYTVIRGGNNSISDKGFMHLRSQYEMTGTLAAEAFTQLEYNKSRLLDSRFLLGGGVRFSSGKMLRGGLSLMYEQENLIGAGLEKNTRLSSYISLNAAASKRFSLNITAYFQPDISDVNDFRFISEGDLSFPITENFSFFTKYKYRYDNKPFGGLKSGDLELKQGLSFRFSR